MDLHLLYPPVATAKGGWEIPPVWPGVSIADTEVGGLFALLVTHFFFVQDREGAYG